ncbi:hypothetical protein [Sphingomonas bacterium]|uniref:hypothetical protein n=1 Tax=Sphingomonas bacterium TaxID=1895847 RepID=UPI001575311B|nr:hypothetical protein [Sphingomonas bacterium]
MAISINTHQIAHVAKPVALDDAAKRFADLDPVEAETTIDAFVAGAIAAWRLDDATYWQRVKFRARLIRTMRRTEARTALSEAKYLPPAAKTKGGDDEPVRS